MTNRRIKFEIQWIRTVIVLCGADDHCDCHPLPLKCTITSAVKNTVYTNLQLWIWQDLTRWTCGPYLADMRFKVSRSSTHNFTDRHNFCSVLCEDDSRLDSKVETRDKRIVFPNRALLFVPLNDKCRKCSCNLARSRVVYSTQCINVHFSKFIHNRFLRQQFP